MLDVLLAGPCRLVRGARRVLAAVLDAAEAVPRIATALEDVRATLHHIERLTAYVAEELPELAFQLERLRAQLDEEPGKDPGKDKAGEALIPRSPRTG